MKKVNNEKAAVLLEEAEADYKKKLRLSHNYVELLYQIYLRYKSIKIFIVTLTLTLSNLGNGNRC